MFLNAHTSAKIYLEMCEHFTALAFTCNHFFTRLFKQDKLVLKDLRFHVRLHVCQRVIRLTATSLFTLKVSVYLFSLPTFVPLPSFPSFLFLSFPLSLLDCPPVFFSLVFGVRSLLFDFSISTSVRLSRSLPVPPLVSSPKQCIKISCFTPRLPAFVFVWEFQLYN